MPSQAPIRDRWWRPSSITTAFACLLLLACLAVTALAWMGLARSHAQYRRRAEGTAQDLCALLADTLVTSYEKIDLVLLGVQEECERRLAAGARDESGLDAFLARQRGKLPVLSALRSTDSEGSIVHGNDLPTGSRISVADRDYFLRLQHDPQAGLVFSKPLKGRVSSQWAIILARRINRPDGGFAGVVYGALELTRMGSHFASLPVGRNGSVTLRDADLTIMIRQGFNKDETGLASASPEFRALAAAGRDSGTYATSLSLDGTPRIHAFLKLQPYGQYLNVALARNEVFEPWHRELRLTTSFLALFLALGGGSSWMAFRALRRQREEEARREQLILELQGALAEVRALSGLLPICSHCKKIRDDNGYWNQIEAYIACRSEAQFTHGICPDCAREAFPGVVEKRPGGSAT